MELVTMKIGDIRPAKYNPRKNLKPGDVEFEKLKASVERWDLVEPLVVNKNGNVLVGGHQRLKVCKALGMKEVQVVLVDLTPEREKLLNMSLNKVCGDWDYTKLEGLFREFDLEELGITGFDTSEIENIMTQVGSAVNDVKRSIEEQHAHPFDPDTIAEEEESDDEHPQEVAQNADGFTVYLSFPDRESAEKWLKDAGIEGSFNSSRMMNVHVGGGRADED